MFENLSPQQRQILMIGAPVVAVFALVSVIQKRNQPVAQAPSAVMPSTLAPSTDAIGTGQLAEFESLLSGQITQLANAIATMPKAITDSISIPAPVVQPPTPAPVPATPKAPPAPAPKAALPRVNSAWYPVIAPQGEDMTVLGTINSGGGFDGLNVGGGVPVYAYQNGEWKQNFDMRRLAAGTPLGTPDTFKDYINYEHPAGAA